MEEGGEGVGFVIVGSFRLLISTFSYFLALNVKEKGVGGGAFELPYSCATM